MPAAAPIQTTPAAETPSLEALRETLFRPMGADGVYARTGLYEGVIDALAALITRHRPAEAEVFRFPPVMTRAMIETSGYLKSFPNLLGCLCCLQGSEADIRGAVNRFVEGEDWTGDLSPGDLVLTPASCYPIYPIAAARGVVPKGGLTFDVACDCFRREPSKDLDRMQSFRMREYVRIGTAEQILVFRKEWVARARALADRLDLPYTVDLASDPFFGRGGQLMAASQVQQALKFELLIPVISEEKPTACMSFNYHQAHFGETWGLRDAEGRTMHTGCVAFGMDRLAVALFATHGLDVKAWPATARDALGL
jgi:seryl-tRNA synthetase